MIKLLMAIALITAAFTANTLIPAVTVVTFQPDTTLTQVVDLLTAHNTWAETNNFTIREGLGFYYRQGSMTIAEREKAVWQTRQGLAEINNQPIDPAVLACLKNNCPVTIAQITLLNPPAALLEASVIASSEAHRDIHPFFRENQILGRP